MNEQQFIERAHANPHDDSPEFLEAVAQSPQRQQLLNDLKTLDASLKSTLEAVGTPENLKQKLLNIPESDQPEAANDSFWRRNFKYAATLLVATGILMTVLQVDENPLEQMVLSHLYSELDFLDVETTITLADVNRVMNSRVGRELMDSSEVESLSINVTEDCWIDIENGVQGVHMVMQGDVGQVTVMVIPSTPVSEEFAISDDRFDGMVSPTPGGNLVVMGEKDESIREFSNLLAANINW